MVVLVLFLSLFYFRIVVITNHAKFLCANSMQIAFATFLEKACLFIFCSGKEDTKAFKDSCQNILTQFWINNARGNILLSYP